jgi:hypothetical protein
VISRAELLSALDLSTYDTNAQLYTVSKSEFLSALVDLSIAQQRFDGARALEIYTEHATDDTVTLDAALEMGRSIEPGMGAA